MTRGTPHRWERGEGLGIPSPLLGCHLGRGSLAPVSVVSRRGQGFRSLSPWLVLVCIFLPYVTLHCALVCGYVLWAWIALGSLWFWCSCLLPCAFVCGYISAGKDCACLSVVLFLVFIAVRVGVRILLMGKDCACLSVVLVLCASFARSCTDTAYGQGLASPWSWCSGRFARIGPWLLLMGKGCACFSVVLVFSAICAHWCTDTAYGQGLRFFSVVLVLSAICAHWSTDTAYGQGLRFSLWSWCSARVARIGTRIWLMGKGCACFSVVLVLSAIACVGVRIRPLGKVALAFPCLGARVFSLDIFGVPV